jgi:hypothetical protein
MTLQQYIGVHYGGAARANSRHSTAHRNGVCTPSMLNEWTLRRPWLWGAPTLLHIISNGKREIEDSSSRFQQNNKSVYSVCAHLLQCVCAIM